MARIDTLTAYKCKFSYLQRNNPLLDEQREAIKNKETPQFSFADFVKLYQEHAHELLIGENADRAILLAQESVSTYKIESIDCWHLTPRAGKQGKPVTVVKTSTKKQYNYGADTAALYNHHVFCYSDKEGLYLIFHRQSGSGCKSVFLETANKVLQSKGLKIEMDLIAPISQKSNQAEPIKIKLQYIQDNTSSDCADNLHKKRKQKIEIRSLELNLKSSENSLITKILSELKMGKISKDAAFTKIKAETKDGIAYNNAELSMKIGKSTKTYPWSDFENAFGAYDITTALQSYGRSIGFDERLRSESDKYYLAIKRSGDVDDV